MHCEEYSCLCMAAPNDSIGDMVLVWREAGNATAVGWMVLHIQKQLFRLLQLSGVVWYGQKYIFVLILEGFYLEIALASGTR